MDSTSSRLLPELSQVASLLFPHFWILVISIASEGYPKYSPKDSPGQCSLQRKRRQNRNSRLIRQSVDYVPRRRRATSAPGPKTRLLRRCAARNYFGRGDSTLQDGHNAGHQATKTRLLKSQWGTIHLQTPRRFMTSVAYLADLVFT